MREQKAITLISLVITIIILIILAGVSFNLLIKNNNLFNTAKKSVADYKIAEQNEKNLLDNYVNLIDNHTKDKKLTAELFAFTPLDSNWNVKDVKEALDYLYNK